MAIPLAESLSNNNFLPDTWQAFIILCYLCTLRRHAEHWEHPPLPTPLHLYKRRKLAPGSSFSVSRFVCQRESRLVGASKLTMNHSFTPAEKEFPPRRSLADRDHVERAEEKAAIAQLWFRRVHEKKSLRVEVERLERSQCTQRVWRELCVTAYLRVCSIRVADRCKCSCTFTLNIGKEWPFCVILRKNAILRGSRSVAEPKQICRHVCFVYVRWALLLVLLRSEDVNWENCVVLYWASVVSES